MAESPRIEELKRRVQSDPASIAFAALAEEYRRAGRFQEAIDTCTAGLVRHPSYLSAHVTLGRALIDAGRLAEAKKELESVLKLAPENLAAIRGLAEIHERLRDEAHHHDRADEAAASESTDPQMTVAEIHAASGFAPPAIDDAPPPSPAATAGEAAAPTSPPIRFRENAPAAVVPPPAQDAPMPWEMPAMPPPEPPASHLSEPSAAHTPEEPAAREAARIGSEPPAAVEMPVSMEMPVSVEVRASIPEPAHVHLEETADPALAGLEDFLMAILRARAERAAVR